MKCEALFLSLGAVGKVCVKMIYRTTAVQVSGERIIRAEGVPVSQPTVLILG